jgi:hypothetical protein
MSGESIRTCPALGPRVIGVTRKALGSPERPIRTDSKV